MKAKCQMRQTPPPTTQQRTESLPSFASTARTWDCERICELPHAIRLAARMCEQKAEGVAQISTSNSRRMQTQVTQVLPLLRRLRPALRYTPLPESASRWPATSSACGGGNASFVNTQNAVMRD